MNERKISLLENITVSRGSSPNEEAVAKDKIAKYASAISQGQAHRTKNPTPVHIYESMPPEEQRFRTEWYRLKTENRKKWKVE